MVAHSLTLDFVHAVWFAIDPVGHSELLLGQSHEFRPERVQQPDIWTAVVASLKEFRKKWGLDDSVASEIAARIERERSRLGQEMDNSKKTAGKSKTEGGGTEYVLVSERCFNRPELKRYSDVTKFFDKLPSEAAPAGIRNYNKGQRRYVHEADWHRYFREKDRKASELLGDEALQEQIVDIEARKEKERERRK